MNIFHAIPIWAKVAIDGVRVKQERKKARVGSIRRKSAKLNREQIMEILDLREHRGWSDTRISQALGIPRCQVTGVIYGGNGYRTCVIGLQGSARP